MERIKRIFLMGTVSVMLCLMAVAGCGMKGPPLPPLKDGNVIAPPENLTYTRTGDKITLAWTHTIDPVTAKIPPEAFKVFAATKGPDQCEGCPFIFKPVGTVPMPHMQFHHTLKQGYHYYFRVQAVGNKDMVSKYSKTLAIEAEE